MAASEETCDGNPNFAIICSFISQFGNDCGVNVPISDLQQMLEDTKNVHEDLAEVHIHLLRRGKKRVTKEKWEKSLIKFCHEYSSVDAWELERFGYKKAKLSVKLELLKRLLELQFDANAKFKSEVNKVEAHHLRIPPVGRDVDGQVYWYQLDKEYNMRLYRQGPEENGEWQLLCSNTDHLRKLLADLQTNATKYKSSGESSKDDVPSTKFKMETDDDLTSRMSETKPNTIIIKTERKDSTPSKKTVESSESPAKDDKDIVLIEKEKTLSSEDESKSEKDQVKAMDVTEVVIKKETPLDSDEKATPMEVEECTPTDEKPEVIADVEMLDQDQPAIEKTSEEKNTPLEGDIKTITELPTTGNIGVDEQSKSIPLDASKDSAMECSTDKDSLKLPSKDAKEEPLIPCSVTSPAKNEVVDEGSAKPDVSKDLSIESPILPTNVTPPQVDKQSKHIPFEASKVCLMKSSTVKESPSALKSSSEEVEEKPHLPSVAPPADKEIIESSHKGSKMKLYEKWSNEKKQAAGAEQSLADAANSQQQDKTAAEKSLCVDLSKSKSSINAKSAASTEEAPMDLSAPIRHEAESKSPNEHAPSDLASSQSKTGRSHSEKHSLQQSPEMSRPFKKKHCSMAVDELSGDLSSRKSVIFETKSSHQFQESSGYSNIKDAIPNNSGFSHLQALQNMCNENPMTCFQGSGSSPPDKRLKIDSDPAIFGQIPLEKSSYSEASCDTISQKYKFSSSQLTDNVQKVSESDVPPLLLKSNVHSMRDIAPKDTASFLETSSKAFVPLPHSATSSSKIISPSVSDSSGKELKDTDVRESSSLGKHLPQSLKADCEVVSIPKKRPKSSIHSVASIMEKDYKDVTKSNVNLSPNNCDNASKVSDVSLKQSDKTMAASEFVADSKSSTNCFNQTSETIPFKTSSPSKCETSTEKNVESKAIKNDLNVPSNTSTKVEPSDPADKELKSTKTVTDDKANTCNSSTTIPESNTVQPNTSSTKTESEPLSLENQCSKMSEKDSNCDKSKATGQISSIASGSASSISNISDSTKSIPTEVLGSSVVEPKTARDDTSLSSSDPKKNLLVSIENESKSKDSDQSEKDKVVVKPSNEMKTDISSSKIEHSLPTEPIKSTTEDYKATDNSNLQQIDTKIEKVSQSSTIPVKSAGSVKDFNETNEKHSIASIISKSEPESEPKTNSQKTDDKKVNSSESLQTKPSLTNLDLEREQINLDSKIDKASVEDKCKKELVSSNNDILPEKNDLALIKEAKLSVDADKCKEKVSDKRLDTKIVSEKASIKSKSEHVATEPDSLKTATKSEPEQASNKPKSEESSAKAVIKSELKQDTELAIELVTKKEAKQVHAKTEQVGEKSKTEQHYTKSIPDHSAEKPKSELSLEIPESKQAFAKPESEKASTKSETEKGSIKLECDKDPTKSESGKTTTKSEAASTELKKAPTISQPEKSTKSEPRIAVTKSESEKSHANSESEKVSKNLESKMVSVKSESEIASTKSESEKAPTKTESEKAPTKSESEKAPTKSESESASTKTESEKASIKSESERVSTKSDSVKDSTNQICERFYKIRFCERSTKSDFVKDLQIRF
ncbi:hypothetical protein JTE90_017663 [Oedothorax gibbosus]|uniref:Remodeling and spacing factor 1 n=1 Tax=Oedothorax gibbosus TaxID=931172 RepID=A0AAV6UFB3_9ARAC|nr:hypothetical protein JTE90_017663 [Oedothorax gibbosus]